MYKAVAESGFISGDNIGGCFYARWELFWMVLTGMGRSESVPISKLGV